METEFRKNARLKKYDYKTNGYYFVTICADYRKPYLEIDQIKEIVVAELALLKKRFSGVDVDYSVVMKNHVHFILILDESQYSLSRIIQALKSITTLKAKQALRLQILAKAKQALRLQILAKAKQALGRAKQALPLQMNRLWQPNYYEHVIRNEGALEKIREYIQNNPEKEKFNWDELDK
ncbi:MAG: transposase [Elusimicrobia bacterium]|nr:transposase [Elusimicrobiota bacterium]